MREVRDQTEIYRRARGPDRSPSAHRSGIA